MGVAAESHMAERAILMGLMTLVLLTALAKVGPSLRTSFEQAAGHQIHDPDKAIDHEDGEARARRALDTYKAAPKLDKR
ncbi:MAG: hypothetical protein AAGK66_04795 [Pseudomonadota bacterium]